MSSTSRRVWTAVVAATCVASGAGLYSMKSESVLRATFATALDHSRPIATAANAATPISGSEEFWLSGNGKLGGINAKKVVSVGDILSLDLGGVKRMLQVSKISEYTPQVTEIDTTTQPAKFVMVTARDAADQNARPVRLVIELDQAAATISAARSGRTL